MLVTLAYPYDGHSPDETVDLPAKEAHRLISDGFARLPVPAPTLDAAPAAEPEE